MSVVRAAFRPFALPLLNPIATAHGVLRDRAGFLVSLEDDAGRVANGEATPFFEFGTEDLAACEAALRRGLADLVKGDGSLEAEGLIGKDAPCARSALGAARLDLAAQSSGHSMAKALHLRSGREREVLPRVEVQALVQGSTPKAVSESARAAYSAGFRTFKLKLAVDPERKAIELDLERVAALRSAVGVSGRIRLDANEAWTRNEAEQAFVHLAEFSVDFVEQPVARDAIADLAAISEAGAIAVAADESLLGSGLARVLAARAASVLVVKPAALGGVDASLALVRRAREEGLRIVWSNLFEGRVGRALAIALASATGEAGEVHGLGTAGLLTEDLAEREAAAAATTRERAKPGDAFAGGAIDVRETLAASRAVAPAWSNVGGVFADGELWEVSA
ncbi:MAG: o-succinylbenzoate synthase [Myxococcota bacterium]